MSEIFKKILSVINSPDYIYSDDKDNGLVENGINPELAPDVLVESAMEKLTNFDALVLIHPDYLKTKKMQVYKETVEGVVEKCLNVGKPVFTLAFDESKDSGLDPSIFQSTIPFPRITEERGFSVDVLQEEVDYISDILDKPPEQIELAWGGMLGDMCVTQWRDNRCLVTKPEFEAFSQHKGRELANPISYGESLPEITVY